MSYNVIPTSFFIKEVKKLAKKYPSLRQDLTEFQSSLLENPRQGTSIGRSCYKVRMAVRSKGAGKSKGARVITCIRVRNKNIYLLAIYDKSSRSTISDKELDLLLKLSGVFD